MNTNIKPLVSVLIPTYNVEKYIEEAIFSILNQTYTNIEVVVVDDFSTDQTYNIVKRIQKEDNRLKVFRNNENLKIARTLNFGLTHCKGEYILRMDGDDISEKNRISKLLNFLLQNPEFSLVGSGFYSINEEGEILASQNYPNKLWKINTVLKLGPPVLHIWLAKAEVYKKLDGYRDIPGVEDYDFLLRMKTEKLNFININDKLYSVRIRSGNSLSTIGYEQRVMSAYVYKLFMERKVGKFDSYVERDNLGYNFFNENEKIDYIKSVEFLKKSISLKAEKRYIKMIFNLIKSFYISKIQRKYILDRVIFKFINAI